ncbi:hypothetical protein KKG72_09285 [bacterium]|nr:hypothetical protein [bacterium]MBU1995001.1 hypothetical protein [bacterium]
MIKKVLVASLLSVSLLFVGCGESEGESRLETQQMLDSGDYEGVITKLESIANSDSDYLALGAAYMGRAGLSISSLIGVMLENNAGVTSEFAGFTQRINVKKTKTALSDLEKSAVNYEKVLNGLCTNSTVVLTDSQKDVCLYKGLSQSMKATVVLGYMGDMSIFGDANESDARLSASVCAMQYANDGSQNSICSFNSPVEDANVTFDSNNTYNPMTITVNGYAFDYLLTTNTTPRQSVVTDGYCQTDFVSCDQNSSGCYPCPVNQVANDPELAYADLLVDSLNNGFDSILAAAGTGDNADLEAEINTFLSEIDTNNNSIITLEEILIYLDAQN